MNSFSNTTGGHAKPAHLSHGQKCSLVILFVHMMFGFCDRNRAGSSVRYKRRK